MWAVSINRGGGGGGGEGVYVVLCDEWTIPQHEKKPLTDLRQCLDS